MQNNELYMDKYYKNNEILKVQNYNSTKPPSLEK